MLWYSNLAIGTRLSLSSAALSAAVVILIAALAAASMPRDSLVEHSGNIIVGQLANGAAEYILDNDNLALQAILNDLSRQGIIAYASVEDATHSILAESNAASTSTKGAQEFSSTIQIHDTIVGYARIKLAGTTAPALAPSMILLLGLLIFGATFAMIQLYLKRFFQTLQCVANRLAPNVDTHQHGTFAELDRICQTMEQLASNMPRSPASKRAILALRLPGVATASIEPERLADFLKSLRRLAQLQQGEMQARADGCLLLFTTGSDTAFRALQTARSLQALVAEDIDYAMAISREERTNDPDMPMNYVFVWQQLCDTTYQSASRVKTLLLCRSALSDQAVHDQVSVAQDDSDHYRVTGYRNSTEISERDGDLPVEATKTTAESLATSTSASMAS